MRIVTVVLIALSLSIPESRGLISSLLDQAEQQLGTNLALFFTGFLIIVAASFVSWFMAQLPEAEPPHPYRVVRRFRV